jgi:hypothetical protein
MKPVVYKFGGAALAGIDDSFREGFALVRRAR